MIVSRLWNESAKSCYSKLHVQNCPVAFLILIQARKVLKDPPLILSIVKFYDGSKMARFLSTVRRNLPYSSSIYIHIVLIFLPDSRYSSPHSRTFCALWTAPDRRKLLRKSATPGESLFIHLSQRCLWLGVACRAARIDRRRDRVHAKGSKS